MLTNSDLQKIGTIIDQKLDEKLDSKLDTKLKPIKRDITHIRKTVDLIAKNYDEADVKLERRVKNIERILSIKKYFRSFSSQ